MLDGIIAGQIACIVDKALDALVGRLVSVMQGSVESNAKPEALRVLASELRDDASAKIDQRRLLPTGRLCNDGTACHREQHECGNSCSEYLHHFRPFR